MTLQLDNLTKFRSDINGLKMSEFKLVLSFSVEVIAANNIYRNTERDRVFDSSRDFAGLTGTDTAL